jgi:hypothetical protein
VILKRVSEGLISEKNLHALQDREQVGDAPAKSETSSPQALF